MFAVRPVKPEEIRGLVRAGEHLHALSAYAHMQYDCGRVEQLAAIALTRPDLFFLEAVTFQDQAVGVLFASVSESYFGPDKVASDLVFFIVPAFQGRCKGALQEIADNYRRWAEGRGAKMVKLSCSTQLNAEKTAGLFEILGFPQTGSLHAVTIH